MQGRDNNATDHSTILSHPMHAEKVIAYDVAVGYSVLSDEDWLMLREVADWRWIDSRKPIGKSKEFVEYFAKGFVNDVALENHPHYRPSALPGLQIDSAREMNTTRAQAPVHSPFESNSW